MPYDRSKPHNNLPQLPPSVDIETKSILKAAINAARALAELKQAGGLVPNQAVLINTIPLLEAQVSSEIENIVTTADRLFRLASDEKSAGDPATKEALRYRTALHRGFQVILDASALDFDEIHISGGQRGLNLRLPTTALIDLTTAKLAVICK